MIVFKPPTSLVCQKELPRLFLAGTIDMGTAVNWQADIENRLSHIKGYIFNPLRDYFDPTIEQSIDNPYFNEQVTWEINAQEFAHVIFMNLLPGSKSPISLLELGLFARTGKLVVCCPTGFWRKGNVEVVCDRFGIPLFETVEDSLKEVIRRLENRTI